MLTPNGRPLMKLMKFEICQPSNAASTNLFEISFAQPRHIPQEMDAHDVGPVVARRAVVPDALVDVARQQVGSVVAGRAVAVGVGQRLRASVVHADLKASPKPAVRLQLQGVVARVRLEDLLRQVAVAGERPEVVIVQRCVGLGILVLRQELGAVRDRVELNVGAQVPSERPDIRRLDDLPSRPSAGC
jgi:hypothetical protein